MTKENKSRTLPQATRYELGKSKKHDLKEGNKTHCWDSIYISGTGMISAAGKNVDANFANMLAGKRNISNQSSENITKLWESKIGKPLFECDSKLLENNLLPHRRTFALAMVALQEALDSSKLTNDNLQENKQRVGVCIGTTVSCTLNDLDFYADIRDDKKSDITPLKRYLCGDISLEIANLLSLDGPTLSVANACSSGTNAIAIGASWIKSGACDMVIVGGADELNFIPYCGFNSLLVMSDEPCLPFDKRRKGLNLGEGAGVLILENYTSLKKRNATAAVELIGYGGGSDAYHITGPHPKGKGLKTAIKSALEMGSMTPSDIDYINAHGTSTINNDSVESAVFADIFDAKNQTSNNIKYSSTKYFTGHTLAAAGAIEAIICVKGIVEGEFPAMVNTQPGDDIKTPPSNSSNQLTCGIKYNNGGVFSTSMAFGGSCAALLFAKSATFPTSGFSGKHLPIHTSLLAARSLINLDSKPTCGIKPITLKIPSLDDELEKTLNCINSKSAIELSAGLKCKNIGVIGPFGKGKKELLDALKSNNEIDVGCTTGQISTAMIPTDIFKTPSLKRLRRRTDKLSLSMYLAAREATDNPDWQTDKKTGLIVVTSLGAYNTTFKFLDGILDYGEIAPSPTDFSNSVHNAPAFYISSNLNIIGPSITVTGFNNPFGAALQLADGMLQEKQCDQILLVAGDDTSDSMLKIAKLWFAHYKTNAPKIIGEGAIAFLLESQDLTLDNPAKIKTAITADITQSEKIFGTTFLNTAFELGIDLIQEDGRTIGW